MSLSIRQNNFTIVPQNLSEAITFADMIAKSSFCPDAMKGKGGDVLIAMQMGAEIGLSPMQALQNIAVIRGRPTVWGDAALAVVMASPHYVSHREWFDGSIERGDLTAHCAVIRKNSDEEVKSFSIEDAKKAELWGKAGPWKQYPQRMLQMRARAFAIRDKFADALRGINIREEVVDYKEHKHASKVIDIQQNNKALSVDKPVSDLDKASDMLPPVRDIGDDVMDIGWAKDMDSLHEIYATAYKYWVSLRDTDNVKKIVDAKNKRKDELIATKQEELDNVDVETGEVKND